MTAKAMNESKRIPNEFYLSATNPTATADQLDMEALALKLIQVPAVVKAKELAAARWKMCVGRDATAEGWSSFDNFMEEYAFHYALKVVNSDANYPKVLGHIYGPAHEWFDMKVPGSRCGAIDNSPDNHYNIIPIDGKARFEISGRCFDPAPAHGNLSVSPFFSLAMTHSTLDWQDAQVNPDGTFIITVGPEPADGRLNHLQTKLDARFIFLRDSRSDWRQIPRSYLVRRLDPPAAQPLTLEQMVDQVSQHMVYDVTQQYFYIRVVAGIDINTCMPPFNTDEVSGLITQMISFGRVKLADDEAFVVTTGSGGARYHSLRLYNYWLNTLDAVSHVSSLNNAQSIANADGSTTYVISIQDPGVHNWLDTTGLHEVALANRWQDLPRAPDPEKKPWIKGELVKLKNLEYVLPNGITRVTPAEREQHLSERLEMFKLRYVE